MIFYINMSVNFTHKARLIESGHITNPPTPITYSSVVSIESVCTAFMLTAINDVDVYAVNIGNA